MPLCTLHLLALAPPTDIKTYLTALRAALPPSSRPLLVSRPIRWIILPTSTTAPELLNPLRSPHGAPTAADATVNPPQTTAWDLLLVLPAGAALPAPLLDAALVRASFALRIGVPGRIASSFPARNAQLLRNTALPPPTEGGATPLLAPSAQRLETTPELLDWARGSWGAATARDAPAGRGPVTMLNLLRFRPGEAAREAYAAYGRAFAADVGSRRGGDAKLVGRVVGGGAQDKEGKGWDEVALAHYPSMEHFVDMAGSADYQAVNWSGRLKALEDTCILMTSEVDAEIEGVTGGRGAKL